MKKEYNNTMLKLRKKIRNIINTPKYRFVKFYFNIFYPIYFKLYKEKILANEEIQNDIIVSFTSIPDRIEFAHLVVKSLMNQSLKPKKIILWLSEDDFHNKQGVPKELIELTKYNFEIRWCENIKPHKKYYFSMNEFPDSIIITVDDDAFYRKKLIENLIEAHNKFPNSVICTRAHRIIVNDGKILPYNDWDYETRHYNYPDNTIFATGVGGVLYPPKSLASETFDIKKIKELCIDADDVWLKAMEILNNTKVVCIPSSRTKYVIGINKSEKNNLSKGNVLNNKNDYYIEKVFSFYDIQLRNEMKK